MTSFQRNNMMIYIPFVGEQYTEEHIHNVFFNFQIGTIRSIRFIEHNYMIGTLDLGSVEEVWGRPAIIEMAEWQENVFTRSINFSINMGINGSAVEFDGPDGDYWIIQKYTPTQENTSANEDRPATNEEDVTANEDEEEDTTSNEYENH